MSEYINNSQKRGNPEGLDPRPARWWKPEEIKARFRDR